MSEPLTVRYASTDGDVIAIHRFLCVMAGPILPGPIDARDSVDEVWRVAREDVALMAMRGNVMVGTLGLVFPGEWWNQKQKFAANRWLFAIPGSKAWLPLIREAKAIAVLSGLELRIISEERGKIVTLNKNAYRTRTLKPVLAEAC